MSAAESLVQPAQLRVDYVAASPQSLLAAADTLAVFGFGREAPVHDDPRYRRVGLRHAHFRRPDGYVDAILMEKHL